MNAPTFSVTDLRHLQRQLNSWRQRQPGRPRLPVALWEAAATHARAQGVSGVARALRIDYYRLQRRVREGDAGGSQLPIPAGFVELKLKPVSSPAIPPGIVELVSGNQRRLLIHTGSDPAAWIALAEAFWKAHP